MFKYILNQILKMLVMIGLIIIILAFIIGFSVIGVVLESL